MAGSFLGALGVQSFMLGGWGGRDHLRPPYIGEAEVTAAARTLADVLDSGAWNDPLHRRRALVT